VLKWVAQRIEGKTVAQIAAADGAIYNTVQSATYRVREDDLEECAYWGDQPAMVKRAYW
jgi:hypothetical protein